jgi:hypothetical protein
MIHNVARVALVLPRLPPGLVHTLRLRHRGVWKRPEVDLGHFFVGVRERDVTTL